MFTTKGHKMLRRLTPRWLAILSMLVVVPLGLLSKRYTGPGQAWFAKYVGNILYDVFWCLFVFFLIPTRQRLDQIPVWVFGFSCIVEFLKLWHPLFLEWARSYLWGRLLLGTTFNWWNLPHYAIGSLISWLWLRQLSKFHQFEERLRG